MIFPILRGILSPRLAPLTYLFLALNLLVFVATSDSASELDNRMDEILTEHQFLSTQGSAFAVMIHRKPKDFSPTLERIADNALSGDSDSRKALGSLAIRNNLFMEKAETFKFGGDAVALEDWRGKFHEILEIEGEHPSYQWGLSRIKSGWIQYFTYQFSHSGFLHLFWNMIFLLIFGSFVEYELGSSIVTFTYIGSGFSGALFFASVSGISSSPLVGASASISGLMSLVGISWLKKEKVRYFFWLLPMKGYFGFANLPSWLVLVVSLLPDLSGSIGASKEFGAVAYTAHIGGAFFGLLIAALLKFGVLNKETIEVKPTNRIPRPL